MAFYNVPGDGWESSINNQIIPLVRNHLLGANSHNAEIETTYSPPLLPVRRRITAQSSHFPRSYSTSEQRYYPSQHRMEEPFREMTEEECAYMELEIKKIRLEEMAYLLSSIPLNVKHGEEIAKRQQRGAADPLSRYRSKTYASSSSSSSEASSSFFQPPGPVPPSHTTATSAALEKEYESNPCQQFVSMYSVTEDKWHPFPATLDTGTPDNWICESSLAALALEQRIETTEVEFMDFGGKTVKSSEMVEIPWCAAEGNRKLRTSKFRIANKYAPFDVILGCHLLLVEEGILKFDKTAWILAKKNATDEEKLYMERERAKAVEESKKLAERKKNHISGKSLGQGREAQLPGRK